MATTRSHSQGNSPDLPTVDIAEDAVAVNAVSDLVVVGNGMVSHAFCKRMTQLRGGHAHSPLSPSSDSKNAKNWLTVFGDESRPAYDRVNLSQVFAGGAADDLELDNRQWYRDHGIDLRLGRRIVRIDSAAKCVHDDQGQCTHYNKLILATGSIPFVPPIDGCDAPGVFVYRTTDDIKKIAQYSQNISSAAVMGGGLLGLEAAKALLDLKLETHIVEMAPILMPRQLDTSGAAFLQKKVETLGIKVHLLKRTQAISCHNRRRILNFSHGEPLDVEMVLISAGIRPRNELAIQAGIELGSRGGVKINHRLETSAMDVYAIGECAEHDGIVYGLFAPGYQMASVLAENLSGGREEFSAGDQSAKLKLLGVDVVTIGSPLSEVPKAITVQSNTTDAYRKLIISKRKLVAVISVGQWPEMNRVQQAIAAGTRLWPWQRARFLQTGNLWPPTANQTVNDWPAGAMVCSCKRICRGELTTAYQKGCSTIPALAQQTGASTVCGGCKPLLAQILAEPEASQRVPLKPGLFIATVLAVVSLVFWFWGSNLEITASVSNKWHQFKTTLQDPFWKQVTGYSLIGISAIGLLLPLRKRLAWFRWGDYGLWRTLHALIGTLTIVGLIFHTGIRLGANMNFVLGSVFLAINVTGVIVGAFVALENRVIGRSAIYLRRWRPRVTRLHFWLLWPLPALLAIHIFCVYYY